jgi:hypothetical protein
LVVGSGPEVQVGFGLCHLVALSHMSLEVATVGEKMFGTIADLAGMEAVEIFSGN